MFVQNSCELLRILLQAKFHYLVVVKSEVDSVGGLSLSHLELVRHMLRVAKTRLLTKHPQHRFQIGFHSLPSMAFV